MHWVDFTTLGFRAFVWFVDYGRGLQLQGLDLVFVLKRMRMLRKGMEMELEVELESLRASRVSWVMLGLWIDISS